MKIYVGTILFFALLLIFTIWIIDVGKRPDLYIKEIQAGYKGIITEKFLRRTTILKIKIENGEELEVGILCDQLKNSACVGDRIEKIPNENYVLLRKGANVLKLPYIYIDRKVRTDRRWPKEWKDKWLESTY